MTNMELKKVIRLVNLLSDFPTWTKDKRNILKLIYKYLESGTHEYFRSHCWVHGANMVSEYYINEANHLRKGTLLKYRGKKIIVMCVGHGSYLNREYLVATIEPLVKELKQ
jgi:hypothetical protein